MRGEMWSLGMIVRYLSLLLATASFFLRVSLCHCWMRFL